MRKFLYATLFLGSLLGVTAFGIAACIGSPHSLMSKLDNRDAGKLILTHTRLAEAECRGHVDAGRDICLAESAGIERGIAKAKCANRAEKLRSECRAAARSW